MISIKQELGDKWLDYDNEDVFWRNAGILQPFAVETQAEFDYLWAMQLMIGKEFTVLLDGRDAPVPNMPPTFVKIDIPL